MTNLELKKIVQELEIIKFEKQQQEKINKFKIMELENGLKQRDQKILYLSKRITEISSESNKKDQKIKQLECYIKQRTQSINLKDLQIIKLQDKLIQQKQTISQQFSIQIKQLNKIIQFQTEQLSIDIKRQQQYLIALQQQCYKQKILNQQKQLLYNYKEQLQTQIQQIQNTNQQLIKHIELTDLQLANQNRQGNDLLCQIGGIIQNLQ